MALSRTGWIEIVRRLALEVLLLHAAVAWIGYGNWPRAALAVVAGVAIYAALPRPQPPDGAWFVERMPSVYMPDLLAALLVTTFFAMPFIVAARESTLGGPWRLMLLMALPGAVSLVIFWIAAAYQCRWVLLKDTGLTVASIRGVTEVAFPEIALVRGEVRHPPRWLSPLLVLLGGLRGVGVALLHGNRRMHLLVIERRAAASVRLPVDSFPDLPRLVSGLDRAGVLLDPELQRAHSMKPRGRHG